MFDWVNDFIQFLKNSAISIWNTVTGWLLDVVYFVFDGLLTVIESLVSAIPVPAAITSNGSPWSGLPSQFYAFASALELPTCLAIFAAAYGIRFLLNLIPGALTRV